ncbi:MAG: hypothetical protein DHS20C12_06140 [Pseudohongiella sp.]|nr:MAG: hypothetical protein DHS20C12_06140 [Pseudohongiella sp.]
MQNENWYQHTLRYELELLEIERLECANEAISERVDYLVENQIVDSLIHAEF